LWYINNKLHRLDGPACEGSNGNKYWYFNGELHKENNPAVEYVDGTKKWYINGKLHRLDGPAIECNNESKFWYIEGKEYTEEKFNSYLSRKTITIDGEEVGISNESFERLKKSLLRK